MKVMVFLLLFLAACSSLGPKSSLPTFQMRPFQEETLSNGLRVIFIPEKSLPKLSMQMLFFTGSIHEPADRAGINALVASLLKEGTEKLSAPEVAEAFARIGVDYYSSPGPDYTLVGASGLSLYPREFLDLFGDMVMKPKFAGKEITRIKSAMSAELVKFRDEPTSFADLVFSREVFGDHPYSYPVLGTLEGLMAAQRADIVKFYRRHYRPDQAILAVTGQFSDEVKEKVRAKFGAWKAAGQAVVAEERSPIDKVGKTLKLVSKRDLKQAQIRVGHLGLRRTDPDFMALRMANLILGGAFASRLNQRVRDDLGLTYSIRSESDARLQRGLFEVSTFTRNEKTAETIRETLGVLQHFVQKGVTANELEAGKALMIGQFPTSVETAELLAVNLMILRRYGIGDDYLTRFILNVNALTVDQVNKAIRKHLQPDRFKIVVYANKKAVLKDLKTFGSWKVEELK